MIFLVYVRKCPTEGWKGVREMALTSRSSTGPIQGRQGLWCWSVGFVEGEEGSSAILVTCRNHCTYTDFRTLPSDLQEKPRS